MELSRWKGEVSERQADSGVWLGGITQQEYNELGGGRNDRQTEEGGEGRLDHFTKRGGQGVTIPGGKLKTHSNTSPQATGESLAKIITNEESKIQH